MQFSQKVFVKSTCGPCPKKATRHLLIHMQTYTKHLKSRARKMCCTRCWREGDRSEMCAPLHFRTLAVNASDCVVQPATHSANSNVINQNRNISSTSSSSSSSERKPPSAVVVAPQLLRCDVLCCMYVVCVRVMMTKRAHARAHAFHAVDYMRLSLAVSSRDEWDMCVVHVEVVGVVCNDGNRHSLVVSAVVVLSPT